MKEHKEEKSQEWEELLSLKHCTRGTSTLFLLRRCCVRSWAAENGLNGKEEEGMGGGEGDDAFTFAHRSM